MTELDYPGILQAADEASKRAQNYYVRLMATNLIVGVVAAGLTIYNFEQLEPKLSIYIISLVLLISSIGLTIAIKYFKFEDLWYQARALAESAKTLTWRYMTGAENFELELASFDVVAKLNNDLQDLTNQFPELMKFMKIDILRRFPITSEMGRIRGLHWRDRLDVYIKDRIIDQINWYSNKAEYNKKKKESWLRVTILFQVFSVIGCIFLIIYPTTSWNLVGLFTTITGACLAWLELKQYQALVQAYKTAAWELTQIRSLGTSIADKSEFERYVLDSENAISREHTMWLVQRRK